MKLKEFADVINEAVKKAGNLAETVEVNIYCGSKDFDIRKIFQLGVVPDVFIEVKEI